MLPFTNPRTKAEFKDWPSGRERVECVFRVEHGEKGVGKGKQCVSRQTKNKHGAWCAPKYTTYAKKCCIVDGSDGRTYILAQNEFAAVSISSSDFKSAQPLPGKSSNFIYLDSDPDLYHQLLGLIEQAHQQFVPCFRD